jgi:hypothetical protein
LAVQDEQPANWIVPLGRPAASPVAVVDAVEAAQSPFGSWVRPSVSGPPRVARMGRSRGTSSTRSPDGSAWSCPPAYGRPAAADSCAGDWPGSSMRRPSRRSPLSSSGSRDAASRSDPGTHRAAGVEIARLQLAGDADRLTAWLGPNRLPITVRPGAPALERIVLTGAAGEIVFGAERL